MLLRSLAASLASGLVALSSIAVAQVTSAGDAGATDQVQATPPAPDLPAGEGTVVPLLVPTPRAQPVPDPYGDVDFSVLHTDRFSLDIGGMGQVLGLGQIVQDPSTPHDRVYLFLPKATLRADGSFDRYSFNLQIALGGEDSVSATSGIDFGLLDLAFNIPFTADGTTYLKIGQFLVPYGREQLTDPGFQDFADTSMENIGFVVGRDVGLALVSKPGPLTLIGGVFTGGGRDVPPDHYLPERFGIPELVARIGIGDLDKDPFYLRQSDPHPDEFRYQLSVSGLFTQDSTVGHSTLLNVKSVDKSILIDSDWNPYINEGGVGHFSQGDWYQAGADAAVRSPLGGSLSFEGEAQVDLAGYSNGYGSVTIEGARAQIALTYDVVEIGLRYDVLRPSDQFAYLGSKITGGQPIQEITPGATYYILGNQLKVVADVPLLINAPVFTEPGVGQYVGTELQDQATVLAPKPVGPGGSVIRQFVPQARLMLQGQF